MMKGCEWMADEFWMHEVHGEETPKEACVGCFVVVPDALSVAVKIGFFDF